MGERRKFPRASCRLQGRVLKGTEHVRCRIADVSESGLCMITPAWMKPRQEIEIEIDVPDVGISKVIADVWHIRREKSRLSSKQVWIAGVIITEADAAYDRLLQAAGVAAEPVLEADEEPTFPNSNFQSVLHTADSLTPEQERDPVNATEHRVFRIRCKARGGPRSRVLTLAAESVKHAEMLAARDLGETWTVLEVREA